MASDAARKKIIAKANEVINSHGFVSRTLYTRHLNEAVCIVRRAKAIDPSVLVAAGFNEAARH